jgi:hypothetical protein
VRLGKTIFRLPAIAAAATAAATATPVATPSAATATTALARCHRTSFVHYHGAAHKVAAIARLDGTICGLRIVDVDETESTCFTGKPIPHYIDCVHGHTRVCKKALNIILAGTIRQVAYKKSHGTESPDFNFGRGRVTTAD